MHSRAEKLPSVVRRMTAGQMLLDGASVDAVAEQLHLSTQTVKRYQAIVKEGGLEALQKMGVGGRSSVLDQEALEWIALALQGAAREHGFESDAWTNARLRGLVEQRYGVRFSRVYIWQIATKLGLGHLLAYFTPSWTRISRQAGQAFHTKLDTDFTASWTAISRQAGQ